MAAKKFVYFLGVCALVGSMGVNAHDSGDSDSSERGGRCECQNSGRRATCAGVTGTKVIGCPNTNSFRQCTGTTCAVQACPTTQVWNRLKNACSECDTGKHVANTSQVCVCDKNTTFSKRTQTCVDCPTAATVEEDRCFCPTTLVRDYTNNACKACPADATLIKGECKCNDNTTFFSETSWTCKSCPGTLILPSKGYRRSSCRCEGTNQIFNEKEVSCYTCPADTTASRDDEECECAPRSNKEFDYKTGTCVCRRGYTQDAAGVCTRTSSTTITP